MASGKKKDQLLQDLKKDDVLMAVVVAEDFEAPDRFGPLDYDIPRYLLPLANKPLLDYALEGLAAAAVQETLVYCASHAAQIKEHLQKSGWVGGSVSSMTVTVVVNEDCRSTGDAMRDLDGRGLLRQDFILVRGDSVFNVNLSRFLEEHKKVTQKDKNATATLVFKHAAPGHHCRILEEEVVLVTNGEHNRILNHQRAKTSRAKFPMEVFENMDEVNVRFDLLDTGIVICSAAVPPLFSDNFDCQTMDDFVKGIIENDLLENTLYMSEITEGYAARAATSMRTFTAVGLDVVRRWLYPFVPDRKVCKGLSESYKLTKHNVYLGANVDLKKDSVLECDVVVGGGSCIGEGSVLINTIVGPNCRIGKNVSLKNCVLLRTVRIGDDCQLNECVLGNDVVINSGVVVLGKTILGCGVEIAEKANIPEETRLVGKPPTDDDAFSDDEGGRGDVPAQTTAFGPKAFNYVAQNEDSDSEEEDKLVHDMWGLTLEDCADNESTASEDSEFGEGFEDTAMPDIIDDEDAKFSVFFSEVLESMSRGAKEGVNPDNLVLEINASRHAYNVSAGQVIESVFRSVLSIALESIEEKDPAQLSKLLLDAVRKWTKAFSGVLAKYCKSQSSQIDCLNGLRAHCGQHGAQFLPISPKIIHFMYDKDLLSDDAILEWFNGLEDEDDEVDDEEMQKLNSSLREKLKPLIAWLEEEDSEEESD